MLRSKHNKTHHYIIIININITINITINFNITININITTESFPVL